MYEKEILRTDIKQLNNISIKKDTISLMSDIFDKLTTEDMFRHDNLSNRIDQFMTERTEEISTNPEKAIIRYIDLILIELKQLESALQTPEVFNIENMYFTTLLAKMSDCKIKLGISSEKNSADESIINTRPESFKEFKEVMETLCKECLRTPVLSDEFDILTTSMTIYSANIMLFP